MGRPKSGRYDNIVDIIYDYTEKTELPILKEVCYQNNWSFQYVMDMERKDEALKEAIKNLLAKKETELERGGLTGKYQQTMAIFSLKQLGWKDIIDTNTTNTQKIVIVNDLGNE